MNFKSIMLASAAGLMTASVASAADLPGEVVPSAVDYVKVCDTYGAGFFYIPGTETCLDISGRVRFRTEFHSLEQSLDHVDFQADGRLQFDARNSTEYGTLRSFFQISDGLGGTTAVTGIEVDDEGNVISYTTGPTIDDNGVEIDLAFIQLGYLTVGLQGDTANGDVLYGDNSFGYYTGDSDRLGISVLVDDLGGGFYAGAGIFSGFDGLNNPIWIGSDAVGQGGYVELHGAVGIAGQPWGGIDLSAVYGIRPYGYADIWTIKATADLVLGEGLDARLVAAYADADVDNAETFTLAGAVSYAVTDSATVYTGIRYDIADWEDTWGGNIGVDYTIANGLVLTGELSYADVLGPDNEFQGLVQLSRTW